MGHSKNQHEHIEATRSALAAWRREHGGRGRAIPAALWARAAGVARANGIEETARALRLDARKLAKLAERGREGVAEPVAFVELGRPGPCASSAPPRTVLELAGREGDRVRVEVAGDGGGVDLVALARAFWGRGA
jgi:multidrug efflux pump subunit AcrA (membrane-fusion protein)